MKRLTLLFAVLAVAALVAAPPAEAACGTGAYQIGSAFPSATYVSAPGPASISSPTPATATGQFRLGRFWEPGKRVAATASGQDEGLCDAQTSCGGSNPAWWGRFSTFPWYINAQMDSTLVDGCPGAPGDGDLTGPDEVIVALFDRDALPGPNGGNAYYYTARTSFKAADFPEFNFSQSPTVCSAPWGPFNMVALPHPNVTLSSRVDSNTVALNFNLADVAAGFQGRNAACGALTAYGTITGYRICQFEGLAEPGRLAAAWSCAPGPATAPGGAILTNFQVDCADVTPPIDNDKWVAIQLTYEGGAYLSDYVSRSVRVECDPNLAQPEGTQPRQPQGREGRLGQQPAPTKGTRRP